MLRTDGREGAKNIASEQKLEGCCSNIRMRAWDSRHKEQVIQKTFQRYNKLSDQLDEVSPEGEAVEGVCQGL